ncbi:glycosyltransferase family 2 protein [Waterburya agarophytonicola K14]|uniref:Beta-monoglucosyldiacylglycerol synthase n=1 Tax=Waterburya agarophytonicola KI4 TaxID=2874699 RepID=A0A964BRT3_9CYAN|nr:glycosyltransferase family 2 protein [Waterburya agarophytonicola]MCC0176660.1 glycosyltransferase family 2 protein [Waterburya agarophytonicola KI4]
MAENYWREKESESEFDPINSLLSELSDSEDAEAEFRADFFQGLAGRRQKAAFLLLVIWIVTISLHLVSWGSWFVLGFAGLVGIQILRYLFAKPDISHILLPLEDSASVPKVSLLVAAKNEEAVISNLVAMLCNLDYPGDKYEIWAIDDRSTDNTPAILDRLAAEYPQLKVVHRAANAGGGKSGALNQVVPQTFGDIIGVFDADAKVSPDLLRKVVPLFAESRVGAVQVRKAIANETENFWTKGQAAEMALDSYVQQQRIAVGGIGELRGNGQFVSRKALNSCGGWNEETITDDLDLTIRLHLDNWKIGLLSTPAVYEEGVTDTISLWHQRNRWAEGGYQRYLDYWRYIFGTPMGFGKRIDLLCWMFLQYIVPAANVPDGIMAIARHRLPVLSPITVLLFAWGFTGIFRGLVRINLAEGKSFNIATLLEITWKSLRGLIYMVHWQVVMLSITARMSIRPKRLKWVKTVHEGRTSFNNG